MPVTHFVVLPVKPSPQRNPLISHSATQLKNLIYLSVVPSFVSLFTYLFISTSPPMVCNHTVIHLHINLCFVALQLVRVCCNNEDI